MQDSSGFASALFDSEWYKVRHCILELDPDEHYLRYGWKEGREPHPLFDPGWYQQTYRISGLNPLKHYCAYGWKESRSPHPLFDGPWYQKKYPDASGKNPLEHYITYGWKELNSPHPLFDATWYHQNNPDLAAVNGLRHYIEFGHIGARSPHPLFDPIWYRSTYRIAAPDPFRHYVQFGCHEGLSPHPAFNAPWYSKKYKIGQENPLQHFMELGWRMGFNPSSSFDTQYYLATHPEVEIQGTNPLVHYLETGQKQGLRTCSLTSEERQLIRDHFDLVYYRTTYPDVPNTIDDLVEHYLTYGYKEGRNPRLDFETSYYVNSHPEVALSGLNPFLHYLLYGKQKNLSCHRNVYLRQNDYAKNPRVYLKDEGTVENESSYLSSEGLLSLLPLDNPYILAVSHDDYVEKCGGVQNVISDEQLGFNRRGWKYLHIAPAQERPLLADVTEAQETVVKLRLDGVVLGTIRFSNLLQAITSLKEKEIKLEAVIHHLMGHAPELIAELVQTSGSNRCTFWIHDYFTLCIGFNLLHNHVSYCDNPPITSELCTTCCYGEERANHVKRIRLFFDIVKPSVVAPSRTAMDIWLRGALTHTSSSVKPLASISPPLGIALKRNGMDRPVQIGFIGTALYHKGWTIFQELAVHYENDPRYRFVHLGQRGFSYPNSISHIPVQVTAQSRDAMIKALKGAFIDVVIIWSLWPESFCFTALEAIAAGCYIIAREGSGNIDSIVKALPLDRGCLLKDETELTNLLKDNIFRRRLSTSFFERRGIEFSEGVSTDFYYRINSRTLKRATEQFV